MFYLYSMDKNKVWILFLLSIAPFTSNAQFTDRYWVFGDSAAIDFSNINSPVPAISMLRSRGTCASICDILGLLFLIKNYSYLIVE